MHYYISDLTHDKSVGQVGQADGHREIQLL